MEAIVSEEEHAFIKEAPIISDDKNASVEEPEQRAHWDRKLEFLLSVIGYSVGVGNLWRFPYVCLRNGGGAFLIPYFIFLVISGVPMFFLELCLGQFSGTTPLYVWSISPFFKGLGWCTYISSGVVLIYYVFVIAWVMFFLVNSFYPTLPWTTCDNWWNTEACVVTNFDGNVSEGLARWAPRNITGNSSTLHGYFNSSSLNQSRSSAEEFWQYYVLRKSDGLHDMGSVQPHLVACLFVTWLLMFLCLMKGVKSLGKVVYVTATLPYLLLTVLLIRNLMLPGSVDGVLFFLKPDFSKLINFSVWVEAALQVFLSLGPGWGTIIAMASYNKFNNNCFRDAVIVSTIDGLSSLYSGFVVFTAVGFMAHEANKTVPEVAQQGPGLVLVAYPEAISRLPVPQLWAVIFFINIILLGLDSVFGVMELLVSGIVDAFPKLLRRRQVYVTAGISILWFLFGLPITLNIAECLLDNDAAEIGISAAFSQTGGIYIFQIVDWFVPVFVIFITTSLECIVISYIYGVDRFCRDVRLMLGFRPGFIMKWCWCLFTPITILIILSATIAAYKMPTYDDYTYPPMTRVFGFLLSTVPCLPIPICMITAIYKAKGSLWQRIVTSLRPTPKWRPASPEHRHDYSTDDHRFQFPTTSSCR